jgi:peroxiredoxin (alkyl hydroperoxide reductase subunit C)
MNDMDFDFIPVPLVSTEAPDFTATAVMPDNSFNKEFKLSDYRGKYVVMFFYPLDFTFVCPSEIIAFDKQLEDFKSRGVEVIGVSTDSHFSHLAWKNTEVNNGGIGNVQFPLVADFQKIISQDYGLLLEGGMALRGTFLIDKDGIVQHSTINNLGLGRNIDEMVRLVDALQHLEEHGEVCPANWNKGDEAMKPTAEGVAKYLAEHADDEL